MDIVKSMLALFLATGAAWIMWLLIGLSVLSVALMLERAFVLRRKSRGVDELGDQIMGELKRGELSKVTLRLEMTQSAPAQVALAALRARDKGVDAMAEAAKAGRAMQRAELEERLGFLGTLGSNAPFIGLLGTVVGIIKAFHDLALNNSGGGARVVMAGISEALVATAMGLFVAIPAVLAFNYFQRRIRTLLASADALVHRILAEVRPDAAPRAATTPGGGDGAGASERQTQLQLGEVAPMSAANLGSDLEDEEGGVIADINVTPMVDIMLVLLIIFMVTASLIVSPSLRVELPKGAPDKASATSRARRGGDRAADRRDPAQPEDPGRVRSARRAPRRARAAAQGEAAGARRRQGLPRQRGQGHGRGQDGRLSAPGDRHPASHRDAVNLGSAPRRSGSWAGRPCRRSS